MTRKDADRMSGGPAGRETAPGGTASAGAVGAEEFRDLALTHGPDLERWPAELRPAARAFAERAPEAAAQARAEAAALDAALADWAAEAPALSDDLFARMAADAEAALPGGAAAAVRSTSAAPRSAPLAAPRATAPDPRRDRPAARARPTIRRPLARFGASAAFAASAALGLVLGYAGDDPVSQGFATLAMDSYEEAYVLSFLDAELLSDDAFPDAEAVR